MMWTSMLKHHLKYLRNQVKKDTVHNSVLNLSQHTPPKKVQETLTLGPKFSLQPDLKKPEVVGLVRNISGSAPEDHQEACIREAVEVAKRVPLLNSTSQTLKKVVEYCTTTSNRLLTSDKEGMFVIMPESMYREKSEQSLTKNFRPARQGECKSALKRVLAVCDDQEIVHLRNSVKAKSSTFLRVFFTAKTHKDSMPFRAIVSERNTWQKAVSMFLQKHLNQLPILDPFLVKSSTEIVTFLQRGETSAYRFFSIDVEDLFYSIPQDRLIREVEDLIEKHGVVKFQNHVGITLASFMELLRAYLASTVISDQNKLYIQKGGTPIGSAISPVLCDIYLAACDTGIKAALQDMYSFRIFRYVDDFLLFYRDDMTSENDMTKTFLDVFC
ncbi:uncharacterized protein LOC135382975 [Ornithodoros turicata]|uniref:uncharacterized protein LOC135382975 n=1 Tax=Ornithodoros turicata TaxID=34597 RepID=UPI0031390969